MPAASRPRLRRSTDAPLALARRRARQARAVQHSVPEAELWRLLPCSAGGRHGWPVCRMGTHAA
eukprot:2742425-Alexandrium_andersonii.AAC.1